ncbi:MAG: TldD/PmbA family protein [Candidatus Thorarchaeota archaeon]
MEIEAITSLLENLLRIGRKKNLDLELFYSYTNVSETVIESNKVKSSTLIENSGLGIRVINSEKKCAFSSTNDLSNKSHLETLIEKTINTAKIGTSNSYASLAFPKTKTTSSKGEIVDIDPSENMLFTKDLFNHFIGIDSRLNIDYGNSISGQIVEILVSTNDVVLQDLNERSAWVIYGLANDGTTITSSDVSYGAEKGLDFSYNFENLDLMAYRLLSHMNAKKVDLGKFKSLNAIFSPEPFIEGILMPLFTAFNGKKFLRKESPFTDQLGEELFPNISIIDDGTKKNSLGTIIFDREGNKPQKISLVDKGIFSSIFHNQFSANEAGQEPTGHAGGSYRTQPSITHHNIDFLYLKNKMDYSDILNSSDASILINGIASYPDYVTGELQGPLKNSFLVLKGEQIPIKELTISGNIYSNLKDGIMESSIEDYKIKLLSSEYSVPRIKFNKFKFIK